MSSIFRSSSARRREEQEEREETSHTQQNSYLSLNTDITSRATSEISVRSQSDVRSTTRQADDSNASGPLVESSLLVNMYNAAEERRARNSSKMVTAKVSRSGSQVVELLKRKRILSDVRQIRCITLSGSTSNRVSNMSDPDGSFGVLDEPANPEFRSASQTSATEQAQGGKRRLHDFTRWSRSYLFGANQLGPT